MNVSSGFKSLILGPHSFESIFDGGAIKIYANAQPASPDDTDELATPIAMITANGALWNFGNPLNNGLSFTRDGPYVYNDASQTWILTPFLTMTAAWFRLYSADPTEAGGSSTTLARIDGTIQELGSGLNADMYLEDTDLAVGTSLLANYFLYTILPISTGA